MDPKLETFLTLCRTMHYGRAAEKMNLSQPAVSKHIQALEAEYGAKLFDYSGRKLRKTRAGELLEQFASTQRYNEEKLIAAMRNEPETHLRIGDKIDRRLHSFAGDSPLPERALQPARISGRQHGAPPEPARGGRAGFRRARGYLR